MIKTESIRLLVVAKPQTVREVADAMNMSEDNVAVVLRRLAEMGKVRRVGFAYRIKLCGGTMPYLWGAA